MNAIAQTRMVLMEHRQIVTQNATEMQRKYVVVLTPILFILHMLFVVMINFISFVIYNSNFKLYKHIYFLLSLHHRNLKNGMSRYSMVIGLSHLICLISL